MLADRLARYCQALRYGDLPDAVVHEAKRRLLDSLGCALGAWNALPCRIARRIAQIVKVPQGATLWGTGHKTLTDLATFADVFFDDFHNVISIAKAMRSGRILTRRRLRRTRQVRRARREASPGDSGRRRAGYA